MQTHFTPSTARRSRLALALLLAGSALAHAQPGRTPQSIPAAPQPAAPAPSAEAPAAPGVPPAPLPSYGPSMLPGDLPSTEPPKAPLIPPSFDAFASDFQSKDRPLTQRWLFVQAGFVELPDQPPGDTLVFATPEMRPELREYMKGKFIEFYSILGAKTRYENVTMIDRDPKGRLLRFKDPFDQYTTFTMPLGTIIYFLGREDTAEGLDFDFCYYDANSLQWVPSPIEDLYLPEPTVILKQEALKVPIGNYVFMLTTFRQGPPSRGSTARPVPLYGYVVLHVQEVSKPGATPPTNSAFGSAVSPTPSGRSSPTVTPPNRGYGGNPNYQPPTPTPLYPPTNAYPPQPSNYPPQPSYSPPSPGYSPPAPNPPAATPPPGLIMLPPSQ